MKTEYQRSKRQAEKLIKKPSTSRHTNIESPKLGGRKFRVPVLNMEKNNKRGKDEQESEIKRRRHSFDDDL